MATLSFTYKGFGSRGYITVGSQENFLCVSFHFLYTKYCTKTISFSEIFKGTRCIYVFLESIPCSKRWVYVVYSRIPPLTALALCIRKTVNKCSWITFRLLFHYIWGKRQSWRTTDKVGSTSRTKWKVIKVGRAQQLILPPAASILSFVRQFHI